MLPPSVLPPGDLAVAKSARRAWHRSLGCAKPIYKRLAGPNLAPALSPNSPQPAPVRFGPAEVASSGGSGAMPRGIAQLPNPVVIPFRAFELMIQNRAQFARQLFP